MNVVTYGASDFQVRCRQLCLARENFVIVVKKKRHIVLRNLPLLLSNDKGGRAPLAIAVDTLRIGDFFGVTAAAISEHNYKVTYEENDELSVFFEAPA